MRVLLLLSTVATATMVVADAEVTERKHTSAAYISNSLLNGLLLAAGYSDTCVSAALDTCGPASTPVEQQLPPIMREARELLQEVRQVVGQYENRLRNCKDLLDTGDKGEGIRQVFPYPGQPYRSATVYCDQTLDDGGWTVIQRRTANATIREDFYRSWPEYQLGFGDMNSEFWLGLDLIHLLSSTVLQELRIDFHDFEGGERLAKYGFFYVGPPETYFQLKIGRYSGDAGDALTPEANGFTFSTHDAVHPGHKQQCAKSRKGAWWYNSCRYSNLNGFQHEGVINVGDGIFWQTWRGDKYSLKDVTMRIRPAR